MPHIDAMIVIQLQLLCLVLLVHFTLRIYGTLDKILKLLTPVEAARITFYATLDGQKRKVDDMFLKVTQAVPVSLTITDKKGNPAKVDGAPQWAVTAPELANLAVAEDGLSAVVTPVGPIGAFKVQVKADADLGEGVKEIVGELDIELTAGDAEIISLAAGQATDI